MRNAIDDPSPHTTTTTTTTTTADSVFASVLWATFVKLVRPAFFSLQSGKQIVLM
jgi:hypothetical protein